MIGFDAVIGHEAALAGLAGLLAADRVPHALLLHGPEGVGKATVARTLSAALLCEGAGAGARPCGRCSSCHLVDAGNHPDLTTVERLPRKSDPRELRQWIVVDQIRDVARLAGLAPRRERRRVFLVDPADRMNAEAQNALLKTLEEPPGRAVLVLVASQPHLLLPTVRSRSFTIGLGPLGPEDLARRLVERGFDRDEALARAALAEGRPGRALTLEVDAHRERRDELLAILAHLARPRAELAELGDMAARVAGRGPDDLAAALDLLQGLLRDAARAASPTASPALVHVDRADPLRRIGVSLGAERAAELVAAVERLRFDLRVNVNRTLVAEALLAAVAGGPLPA